MLGSACVSTDAPFALTTGVFAADRETGTCVLYDENPVTLVERLIHYYQTEHYRKPSCFCEAEAEENAMAARAPL